MSPPHELPPRAELSWEFARPDANLSEIFVWIAKAPAHPWGVVIPLPFVVLDAAIAKFFRLQMEPIPRFPTRISRQPITSHSCVYKIRTYHEPTPGTRIKISSLELQLYIVNNTQTEFWFLPRMDPETMHIVVRDCMRMVLGEQSLYQIYEAWASIDTETTPQLPAPPHDSAPETPPARPDPAVVGWPTVFAWDKQYGRLLGITSDKELAQKLGLSHAYVREMRVKHGEPRRKTDDD